MISKVRFSGTEKELEIASAYVWSLDQLEQVMRRGKGKPKAYARRLAAALWTRRPPVLADFFNS